MIPVLTHLGPDRLYDLEDLEQEIWEDPPQICCSISTQAAEPNLQLIPLFDPDYYTITTHPDNSCVLTDQDYYWEKESGRPPDKLQTFIYSNKDKDPPELADREKHLALLKAPTLRETMIS